MVSGLAGAGSRVVILPGGSTTGSGDKGDGCGAVIEARGCRDDTARSDRLSSLNPACCLWVVDD